jgi:hypothetical protein
MDDKNIFLDTLKEYIPKESIGFIEDEVEVRVPDEIAKSESAKDKIALSKHFASFLNSQLGEGYILSPTGYCDSDIEKDLSVIKMAFRNKNFRASSF